MRLLLCLDGADPDTVTKLHLPNIKSIGKLSKIRTYSNSGPSWASLVTGVPPIMHGMGDITIKTSLSQLKHPPLWRQSRPIKIGVANLPIIDNPEPINGWMVGGLLCAKKIYTYPAELTQELNEIGYKVWISARSAKAKGWEVTDQRIENKHIEKEWRKLLPKRTRGFMHLVTNHPVDLAILCISALDAIQHRSMHRPEKVHEFYRLVDREVGRLIKEISFSEVEVVSDHGFRRVYGREPITGDHRPVGIYIGLRKPRRIEEVLFSPSLNARILCIPSDARVRFLEYAEGNRLITKISNFLRRTRRHF